MYAHVLQPLLIVGCASSLLLAQETSNPKEPAAGSETDTASSTITLPIRPSGRYAFLLRPGSPWDFSSRSARRADNPPAGTGSLNLPTGTSS
jgi:hypothetical protein